MKEGIEGPDCTTLCKGDCCSIKIDIPKILAEEYLKRSYASETDFIRSNLFSFHLRFDEKTGKCFFYDRTINGCRVHFSGIKPPQCWIYPTNFRNNQDEIQCKRLSGWSIKSQEKTSKAEKLLEYYIFLCKLEAKKEINNISYRISNNHQDLISRIRGYSPSKLGGFQDGWNHFEILSAEGFSLQMKKFCLRYKKECIYLPDKFLECEEVCEKIANKLVENLTDNIKHILAQEELDYDGIIPLYKLFKYSFR